MLSRLLFSFSYCGVLGSFVKRTEGSSISRPLNERIDELEVNKAHKDAFYKS